MIAATILTAATLGLALLVIALAWGPKPTPTHTRPASSNRKAGRVR
jgi:hypothetical protein